MARDSDSVESRCSTGTVTQAVGGHGRGSLVLQAPATAKDCCHSPAASWRNEPRSVRVPTRTPAAAAPAGRSGIVTVAVTPESTGQTVTGIMIMMQLSATVGTRARGRQAAQLSPFRRRGRVRPGSGGGKGTRRAVGPGRPDLLVTVIMISLSPHDRPGRGRRRRCAGRILLRVRVRSGPAQCSSVPVSGIRCRIP